MSQLTSPPQSSANCETSIIELSTSASSVIERDDTCSEKDRDSVWEKERCASRASSSSAATLTNVRHKLLKLFLGDLISL